MHCPNSHRVSTQVSSRSVGAPRLGREETARRRQLPWLPDVSDTAPYRPTWNISCLSSNNGTQVKNITKVIFANSQMNSYFWLADMILLNENFSSLTAPNIVVMTVTGATTDDEVDVMIVLSQFVNNHMKSCQIQYSYMLSFIDPPACQNRSSWMSSKILHMISWECKSGAMIFHGNKFNTLLKKNDRYYSDVIMSAKASQIISVSNVYSNVCPGTDQRKHQSSESLAFVRGIRWWIPHTKGH